MVVALATVADAAAQDAPPTLRDEAHTDLAARWAGRFDVSDVGTVVTLERDTGGRPVCRVTLLGSHSIVQTFHAIPIP